jgi:hypothetical protein
MATAKVGKHSKVIQIFEKSPGLEGIFQHMIILVDDFVFGDYENVVITLDQIDIQLNIVEDFVDRHETIGTLDCQNSMMIVSNVPSMNLSMMVESWTSKYTFEPLNDR